MSPSASYLITGASGFLGRHVIQAMRREWPEPRPLALVRDRAEWEKLDWHRPLGEITTVEGDVTGLDPWQHDGRLDGLGGIFHLAAQVKHSRQGTEPMWHVNVEGTLNMVRLAAAKRCRLVFVSTTGTVACFERPTESADEEAPYCEERVEGWPYYASKIVAERRARELAEELGVEMVIIRPPMLLGPGDHRFRSTTNVIRLLRGRLPFLLEGGIHYVDIRDAATALLRAMGRPEPRPVYHLPGTASELDAFFRLCAEEAGIRPSWRRLPGGLLRRLAGLNQRLGLHLSLLPDPVVVEMAGHYWDAHSRYSADELEFSPRPPRETVADTIAWLQAHHPDLQAHAA